MKETMSNCFSIIKSQCVDLLTLMYQYLNMKLNDRKLCEILMLGLIKFMKSEMFEPLF